MVLRGQDLPSHAPGGDGLDFEPKLMLDGPKVSTMTSPTPSPEEAVARLEKALREAEERAVDAEELAQEGILSKVEAEERALRVIEVTKQLDDARLAAAALKADAVRKSFAAKQAGQVDLDAANAELKAAREAAGRSTEECAKAELGAAQLDLKRKRKLYEEGVDSLHEVQAAEDRVLLLSGTAPQ